ncbi:RE1-silencing transcription factor A-like [Cimex lectularius]|uniref:Uncharacterized protein n=1 Tax=Cimex lectularius TaxID=79782 RepID=A0A8I6SN14_CIMLE|nr:RE1-silencing transcription factor A-like [Cimex lectularius]
MANTDAKSLAEAVLINLSKQRSKGEFCDVQLTNGPSKLWAHSCVLATVSPFITRYFLKHFGRLVEWSVNKPIQLNISTLTKCKGESRNNCMECVEDTVDFIYTGKIKLKEKHLDHVLNLSNNLELDDLLLICQRYKNDKGVDFFKTDDGSNVEAQISEKAPTPLKEPHEVLNTNESKEYSCDTCGFKSKDDEQFLLHDFIFHRFDYTCLSCSFEESSIAKIVEHLQDQSHDNTVCSICLFNACDVTKLKQHFKEHADPEPFKCQHCSLRFKDRSQWLRHFSSGCQSNSDLSVSLHRNLDSCLICKVKFENESITKKHMKVFHKNKYTCLSCEYSTFKISKIINHLKVTDHTELYCSLCLQETKSKIELQNHLEEHLQKLPFNCKRCSVSYPNRRQWWRHMSCHYDEKPFGCIYCQLKFKNNVLLNTHVLRMHKKKKYICSVCGLAEPFPSLLEKHMKSHRIQKQEFVCTFPKCNFRTNYKVYFAKHRKEHVVRHNENKSSSFQCSICKIFFSLEKNLNRHMRFMHNSKAHQFKCPQCNYLTVRLDKIKDHCVKVHCMGERESNEIIKLLKLSVSDKSKIKRSEGQQEDVDLHLHHKRSNSNDKPTQILVPPLQESQSLMNSNNKNVPSLNGQESSFHNIVQLQIEENGRLIVQGMNSEKVSQNTNGEFPQLQMDDSNVVIQHLSQSESSNRRRLQIGDDGSVILQESNEEAQETFVQIQTNESSRNYSQLDIEEIKENVIKELSNSNREDNVGAFMSFNIPGVANSQNKEIPTQSNNFTQLQIEEINGNTVIQEIIDKENTPGLNHENGSYTPIQINTDIGKSMLQGIKKGLPDTQASSSPRDFVNESVKKTLFLNKNTGEINILSSTKGKPIPIANVTATNLLTIGNFREGTGSVTLNETTGVLTFNNINSGSTGAVFLNESTGELSYIDLNGENPEEIYSQKVELNEMEQTQLDEVTGEIVKIDNGKTVEKKEDNNIDEIFDFDMENFNEDSFDGFDDFDELLFDNVNTENQPEHQEENNVQKRVHFMMPGNQTPRLDEMTGEFTFDETSCSTADIWNELKPFRDVDEVEDDSLLENVNSGSYNFLLNEITGEFYK